VSAWRSVRLLMLVVSAMAVCAQAQADSDFKPTVGQVGKDVVWVPSPQALVNRMLDMAKVTSQDFVMDLGSGDGRTVISAARRGARALGIEYNPDMVELSRRNAAAEGLSDKAQFVQADIFETDLSRASVITLFLLPDLNLRLRPAILSLKPGTRIVSNTFGMSAWEADETFALDCNTYCTAHLWIVPARVEGKWRLPQGELTLKQAFQKITGTLLNGASELSIEGRLRGDEIMFVAGGVEYRGRVSGNTIEGMLRTGGAASAWAARR